MGRAYADGKEAKKQTTGPGGAYAVRLVESQPHPQVVHLAEEKLPHARTSEVSEVRACSSRVRYGGMGKGEKGREKCDWRHKSSQQRLNLRRS